MPESNTTTNSTLVMGLLASALIGLPVAPRQAAVNAKCPVTQAHYCFEGPSAYDDIDNDAQDNAEF